VTKSDNTNTNNDNNPNSNSEDIIELVAVPAGDERPDHRSPQEFEAEVALWEDSQSYQALSIAVHRDHPSSSVTQRHLVDQIAQVIWRQRRIPKIEAALLAKGRADFYKDTWDGKRRNIPRETIDTLYNLNAKRNLLLLQVNSRDIINQFWQMGVDELKVILPKHPQAQWKEELIWDEDKVLTSDKGGKRYQTLLTKLDGLSPLLRSHWEMALLKPDTTICTLKKEDGFLPPQWSSDFDWGDDDWEKQTETHEWSFEANIGELSVWLIDNATNQFEAWQRQNIIETPLEEAKIERISDGLYFENCDEKILALTKYEAHLHKHLLELINAYYVIAKQNAFAQAKAQ
jgi:hypothetical protein